VRAGWQWPPGWRVIRRAVFAAKGRVCWWCGALATTVDHYPVPAALGGPHTVANLIPACARCNYSRGASFGNRLRGPLTQAQRRAIAAKDRERGRESWRSARRW
jgi:5-methylcytosine-specific restriction endonuclease McrA